MDIQFGTITSQNSYQEDGQNCRDQLPRFGIKRLPRVYSITGSNPVDHLVSWSTVILCQEFGVSFEFLSSSSRHFSQTSSIVIVIVPSFCFFRSEGHGSSC